MTTPQSDPIQTWMEGLEFEFIKVNKEYFGGGYWNIDLPDGKYMSVSPITAAFFYAVMEREKKMSETRAAVTIRSFLANSNNPKRDGYAIRVCDTYLEATEAELATLNKGEENHGL